MGQDRGVVGRAGERDREQEAFGRGKERQRGRVSERDREGGMARERDAG